MPGPPLENEVMGWLLPAEGGSLGCVCVCNKPTPHEAIAFSHKGSSHSVAVWMMGQVGETSLPGRATAHHVVLYQLSQAYGVLDHIVCLLPTRHETHLGPSQWCQEQFLKSPAVFLPEILQGLLVPTGMAEEGPRDGSGWEDRSRCQASPGSHGEHTRPLVRGGCL